MKRQYSLLAMLLLAACEQENEVYRQTHEDVFYQVPTDLVDILWVVDNSLSMADEQAEVADKFSDFISSVEDTDLDFHIGVITTDMDSSDLGRGRLLGDPIYLTQDTPNYAELFAERVQVGTKGSDREKGIDAAYTALSEPMISGSNAGFLRDGATLSIIYVSDENDCTDRGALDVYTEAQACYEHSDELVPVRELLADYSELKSNGERILVSSIVGPEITQNCDGAVPGFRYETMAEGFGGIIGNICQDNFASIMERLGLQVSGELTSFQLTYSATEGTIEVWVNDDSVPEDELNGWTYDTEYAIVYFHGDEIPVRDSTIAISYEIVPGSQNNTEE